MVCNFCKSLENLSLSFPQLWQSQGLDLYIIPYGCIATGNMMGMIEVVQEADTVAKVTIHLHGYPTNCKQIIALSVCV